MAVSPKHLRGIRQRNGKFMIDLTVKGTRHTDTFTTEDEAIVARAKLKQKLKGTTQTDSKAVTSKASTANTWTLQTSFERAQQSEWNNKEGSFNSIRNAAKVVEYFGGRTPVDQITTDSIDTYVEFLQKEGNSDATINRKLSALSLILRTALKRRKLLYMPHIPRRKEKEGRLTFLSVDQEIEILAWLRHLGKMDHLEACTVLIDTGFRTGELWRVTAADVDHTKGTITLWKTKSGKPRTIPMTERVKPIIKRRCLEYPQGKLWPQGSNEWMRKGWAKMRAKMQQLNNPDWVPHILRHTCCSRMVQRGVPLLHVQRWMGHCTIVTTQRYAHLAPNDLFAAAKVLDSQQNQWQHNAPQQ